MYLLVLLMPDTRRWVQGGVVQGGPTYQEVYIGPYMASYGLIRVEYGLMAPYPSLLAPYPASWHRGTVPGLLAPWHRVQPHGTGYSLLGTRNTSKYRVPVS